MNFMYVLFRLSRVPGAFISRELKTINEYPIGHGGGKLSGVAHARDPSCVVVGLDNGSLLRLDSMSMYAVGDGA